MLIQAHSDSMEPLPLWGPSHLEGQYIPRPILWRLPSPGKRHFDRLQTSDSQTAFFLSWYVQLQMAVTLTNWLILNRLAFVWHLLSGKFNFLCWMFTSNVIFCLIKNTQQFESVHLALFVRHLLNTEALLNNKRAFCCHSESRRRHVFSFSTVVSVFTSPDVPHQNPH